VVASLNPLGRALGSSRQARALHEAFWQFLWSRRAARARRGSQLLALFVEQLARRKPRLIALLRSRAAGHHLVDRALAGTAPRQPHKDAPRAEAKPRAQPAPKRPREPIAAPVFVDAADRQALRRWSAAHPTASVAVEAAIRDALTALGRVGFSLDREADRVALRAAFWQLVEATARPPLDSNAWLAALFDRLRRDAPTLLARLRATAAGERLLGSVQPSPRAASREPPATIEPSPPEWLVRTAGVVLLWSMLPRYFERLGMLERGSFRDLASQERACGLIHFLASGQRTLREHEQVLGKVLCGLDVAAPIPLELELDDATRAMSEDLLRFVIASWKGIGETSVQGLRGTFLCRDGRLTRSEASWMLDVEHKTYDILLGSFPWQTSVVKLPWMGQPLMVHWR
ncbi:MAG TPA: contractile injection system tape measure protein, partial [Kofleriaceae bacterium]|nr:contractile injection system tape measure protein [Kofleriaceae bacterium]